ncbi:MAG: hypothetical protein HY905_27505 [Deltaproteobacteria bacterium]|nr:hypothetical protein [Deltaproteobacteria bacterium]
MLKLGVAGRRGAAVSVGGAADVVIARALAAVAMRSGAARMDVIQTVCYENLAGQDIQGPALDDLGLEATEGCDPGHLLRHCRVVPNPLQEPRSRGKGKRISAALDWPHGERLLGAALSRGFANLFGAEGRCNYDFVIGVDGGGDVLGLDEQTDMRVLAVLRRACAHDVRLAMVVAGLGADGATLPEQIRQATLSGWDKHGEERMDLAFAALLEEGLRQASCWLDNPLAWGPENPAWNYDLKVPQIISMAIRGQFPFACPEKGLVCFPRRGALRVMCPQLLATARFYLPGVPG